MSAIREAYDSMDADLEFETFEQMVENKIEEMSGLVDKEGAAVLVSQDFDNGAVTAISSIDENMDSVEFTGKVVSVGNVRTFQRDSDSDEDDSTGKVCNVDLGDESGQINVAFWDSMAQAAGDNLEIGDVLNVKGYPKDGFNGLQVNVKQVEKDSDAEVDVRVFDTYQITDLEAGKTDVNVIAMVLDADDSVHTFDRDDGTTGQVSNMLLADESGRINLTLWGEKAQLSSDYDFGQVIKVVNGSVRENDDGDLEVHTANRTKIEDSDEQIEYRPNTDDIETLEVGDTATIAGGVTYVDDINTFERDDGSESTVRSINLQDGTDQIRLSLWGDMAELEIEKADVLVVTDVNIRDGMEGGIEGSVGWKSSVIVTEKNSQKYGSTPDNDSSTREESKPTGLKDYKGSDTDADPDSTEDATSSDPQDEEEAEDANQVELTGMVLGTDDGEVTIDTQSGRKIVVTSKDIRLGEEITVRGTEEEGIIEADEIF